MTAADGKQRLTDLATSEALMRLSVTLLACLRLIFAA
jgi:hypothetical protein